MTDDLLFPYDNLRPSQKDLIYDIQNTIDNHGTLFVHAPTGLGKTAASIGPALTYAIKNKGTVFFLTSRHTQHMIALETVKAINARHGCSVRVADIIGKKWLCVQDGISMLPSHDFTEYCKYLRENQQCEFYTNVRENGKLSILGKKILADVLTTGASSDALLAVGRMHRICPYELSIEIAKDAQIIVGDYYYMFNPHIRKSFLAKIQKDLDKSIIIVDEAHNLPDRLRELGSERLTSIMIARALKEARHFNYQETVAFLVNIERKLHELSQNLPLGNEKIVTKDDLLTGLLTQEDSDATIEEMYTLAELVRTQQKYSALSGIARFLEAWKEDSSGFCRFIRKMHSPKGPITTLTYRCLDPSLLTKDLITTAQSCIFMSGTLTPSFMYRDLLGAENATLKAYESPFPSENRLNLIVPITTTKFSQRSVEQYKRIAGICAGITNMVPGNTIIFFPSYEIRDAVYTFFSRISTKTIFREQPQRGKQEKEYILEQFKAYQHIGAVMLGVVSGSYSEGVDLPGDLLKGVIVVGLPLLQPDLETKELIAYFDRKFGKGWDYGYVYPAFNKVLQGAGRCIRSETDRGIIVFLDERYQWPQYKRCFPQDWKMTTSEDYLLLIEKFFSL